MKQLLVMISALGATTLVASEWTDASREPSEAINLPRFEVRADRITDFGMSVRTNFGVLFGAKIKWIRVGTVVEASSAASAGLKTDDQILLIGETKAPDLNRDQMLSIFFGRTAGDRLNLLVREAQTRHYRAVELRANPPRTPRAETLDPTASARNK